MSNEKSKSETTTSVFKAQHMPSLEKEPSSDIGKFPSARLGYNFQKVEFLKKAYAPLCNAPVTAARVNLRKLMSNLSVKQTEDKSYFSDSYYTWLALFQDTFNPECAAEVTKSICFFNFNLLWSCRTTRRACKVSVWRSFYGM